MMAIDRRISSFQGRGAPPRRNGELVFESPWQGRAFGLGVALCERGLYAWEEFQVGLIAAIAAHGGDDGSAEAYYREWIAALEKLLIDKGIVRLDEVERRSDGLLRGERG
jgi:nitrile hydratase accessory protein